MKWRHWAILIVLVLLNYIIFSTAFTQLAEQRRPRPRPTRTLEPTFESVESAPMAWIVLPTNTPRPTRAPFTPTPVFVVVAEITPTLQTTSTISIVTSEGQPAAATAPAPTETAVVPTEVPPTATAASSATLHIIKQGESLSQIAQRYGVTTQSIVEANNLANPNHIVTGQKLVIPGPGQASTAGSPPVNAQPTDTPRPQRATATPTRKPVAPTATLAAGGTQFTAQIIWDPVVAPNCSGPSIAKQSIIQDASGNPVNGARVEVTCYNNVWISHPSGNPGEYDPGHYDFSFGQTIPQEWTCTARVVNVNGQPVVSSEVATIQFDTNDCKPHGSGHQVVTLNWTKHW